MTLADQATDAPSEGGCQCGVLRYRITKAPLSAHICHCTDCQNRTGSAYAMAMLVPADGFTITQGKARPVTKTLPSGLASISHHCPHCLIRTHTTNPAFPQVVTVRPGTLDAPVKIKPAAQLWTRSAHPWAVIDGLLAYEENVPDFRDIIAAYRTQRK